MFRKTTIKGLERTIQRVNDHLIVLSMVKGKYANSGFLRFDVASNCENIHSKWKELQGKWKYSDSTAIKICELNTLSGEVFGILIGLLISIRNRFDSQSEYERFCENCWLAANGFLADDSFQELYNEAKRRYFTTFRGPK